MPFEFPGHEFIRREDPETAEVQVTVEGEPWTGLVVVADVREFESYGLVQALEWERFRGSKDPESAVTVWKGPQKPDELIEKKHLSEVECQTVLVDNEGFYTCPPIIDLIRDEVLKRARKYFDEEANQRAAEARSYIDEETVREKYDTDDVLAIAVYGFATAVNGEYRGSEVKIPKGWVELKEEGGRTLGGDEEQVELEYIAENIAEDLTKDLKRSVSKKEVEGILKKEYGGEHGYIMWSSDGGYASVYIHKKDFKAYEKQQEKEAEERLERETRERAARFAKEAEERRTKIRRGGWPNPKDWSPTGEL